LPDPTQEEIVPTTTTTTTISGGPATVAYDRSGTGPGLVLVHGTAATRQQWLPLTAAVADRFTVVAPDLSGSGDTVDHGGPLTLADLAAEVLAAADHAGLDAFHLVGHSLGATVATHLAATHPERVRSLVLHAGWVRTDTRFAAELTHWLHLLATDRERGTTHFAEMLPLVAFGPRYWAAATVEGNAALVAQLAELVPAGAARQIEVDLAVDLRGLLGRITAPALVLASAHDRIVAADQQRALLAGIPDARHAELDAGHGAPAEDPDGFVAAVVTFLDRTPVPT
jgi:pimeloyl-ACP methyl ester carboxylesterase